MAGKTSQKSSKELYREAAQILGIACEFDEDCRCIECQVSIKICLCAFVNRLMRIIILSSAFSHVYDAIDPQLP